MKVLLSALAAILLVGAVVYSLFNWITPFSKMRVREEVAANAPVTAGGSSSGSPTAVPEQSPAAFRTISTAIHSAVAKVQSWAAKKPSPSQPPRPIAATAQPRPQATIALPSPPRDANVVTITRDVSIHIKYGIVGLRRGTKVALVSRDGTNVHVRDATGEVLVVPASATDLH